MRVPFPCDQHVEILRRWMLEIWAIIALLCCLFGLYCTLSKREKTQYVFYVAALVFSIIYALTKGE